MGDISHSVQMANKTSDEGLSFTELFSTLLTCGQFYYAKAKFEEAKQVVTKLAKQAHMRRSEDEQRFSRWAYELLNLPNVFFSQPTWMESLGVIRDDWENLRTESDSVHGAVRREIQVHLKDIREEVRCFRVELLQGIIDTVENH